MEETVGVRACGAWLVSSTASGLDGLYGCWMRSTLELLRVGGTLGVAKAACVTNLPTDPDCALHTVGLCSLRLLLEAGLGLNEN